MKRFVKLLLLLVAVYAMKQSAHFDDAAIWACLAFGLVVIW